LATEFDPVAADSDVLMNLLATSCAVEILQTTGLVLMTPPTVAGEALYLESEEAGGTREQIDLTPLESAGVLVKVLLDDLEVNLMLELARIVDDGEAEVLAISLNRGIKMATDDRKARRLASERHASLISTLEILQRWESKVSVAPERMQTVLSLVARRSRYRPALGHTLYEWWSQLIGRSLDM
jgi:predicted nucleic acid-binding protein